MVQLLLVMVQLLRDGVAAASDGVAAASDLQHEGKSEEYIVLLLVLDLSDQFGVKSGPFRFKHRQSVSVCVCVYMRDVCVYIPALRSTRDSQ